MNIMWFYQGNVNPYGDGEPGVGGDTTTEPAFSNPVYISGTEATGEQEREVSEIKVEITAPEPEGDGGNLGPLGQSAL